MNPYTRPLHALRSLLFRNFRLVKALGQLPDRRTVVLNYHSVRSNNLLFNSTPTDVFEQHLAWLAAHCEVVDFSEVLEPIASNRPRVALVFDDGFLDNLQHAVPLLKKYGLRATFFVSTGFLRRDPVILDIFARVFRTNAEDFLDTEALRELFAAGMLVGAHTHTHRNLRSLPPYEQEEELRLSKEILEQTLGAPVNALAYPFGVPGKAFDLTTCSIAKRLGYTQAGTVCWRGLRPQDSPMRVPRITVVKESELELEAMVYGALDPIGYFQEWRFALQQRNWQRKIYAYALLEGEYWGFAESGWLLGML